MSYEVRVCCDRCGASGPAMRYTASAWPGNAPYALEWSSVGASDLCPKCADALDAWMKPSEGGS